MLVCSLVFQPVIRLVQVVISVIEYVLVQVCRLIQQLVNVATQVLKYVCNNVVHTVCGAVCSVICGICDFFCGIFGCDCGCRNVCNNVCNVVTEVVCGWTWVVEWVLQAITTLVCKYILQAIITLLNVVEAIVTMVLTWVCTLIDVGIRWFLCWTYLGDIFNSTRPRRFKAAPKIVRNHEGHSDWFIYVNNSDRSGSVDQNLRGYILSDRGKPLTPVVDSETGAIEYFEVATEGNFISGRVVRVQGDSGEPVRGEPCLYYAYKMIEVASHLFGDVFAGDPADDGRGSDFTNNLLTYTPNVQAWLDSDGQLPANNYNNWPGKYSGSGSNYFGDRSLPDVGLRADTDSTCSRPTNTFFHFVNGGIELTPGNTQVAETMSCGPGQTLTFDQTNFLMLNKDTDGTAVTTYLVSKYNADDSSVGCNDLLGYTVVTFEGSDQPQFISMRVLPFESDTNRMMSRIVENISSKNAALVRVAETYIHECGHQSGLLHDSDKPDCENDTTLHIAKVMHPGGSVRRAFTRLEWCMVRLSAYVTSRALTPFTQAPELPDSGSTPGS